MRAQLLTAFGGPEKFRLTDVPRPKVRLGTVLVRLGATSVNPIDIKIRNGLPIGPELPAILGADIAGVVEAVAEDVTQFVPGEAVYGCAGGVRGQGGTLAEYILADVRLLARKPLALSMREAAALPLVTLTAWDALERSGLTEGQHILVHGGTGGVGHVAVQLAKAIGARVAATVRDAKAANLARGLGVEETILFREDPVEAYVDRLTGARGFDVVFDTIGGDNLAKSFAAAAVGGRIATTNARTTQDLSAMHAKGLSLHAVFILLPMLTGHGRERHGALLGDATELIEAGKLRPLIDPARFTLETAPDAHRHAESGTARGKIIVEIDGTL